MEFLTTETFLIKMLFSLKKKCLNLAPPLKKKKEYIKKVILCLQSIRTVSLEHVYR